MFCLVVSPGLEAYVINADTTRPKFKNLFNPDHKWLVDQPDAIYLTATISTDFAYVIEGKNLTPCTHVEVNSGTGAQRQR